MANKVPLVVGGDPIQQLQAADVLTDVNGVGYVRGPATATDNAIARYDLTTGKLIQNSLWTIADTTGLLTLTHTNYILLVGTGTVASASPSSTDNVVIGNNAGASATFTGDNYFMGNAAGASSTWVRDNIAWGRNAGNGGTYGNQNIMVGLNAGLSGVFDEANLALGASAMRLFTGGGDNNIALGAFSLFDATAGANNLCIGASSGRGLDDATAGNNIFIGINAGGASISQKVDAQNTVAIGADVATLANGEIRIGGTSHNMTSVAGGLTANDAGLDSDTRIEGDTATNLFVLDAGLDAVQFGTTVAGALADFRSTVAVFNEPGNDVNHRFEGDSLAFLLYLNGDAALENIALLATAEPNWQTMDGGLFIGDATTAPTGNPASGVFAYSSSADLFVRNGVGAITQLSGVTRGATATVADGGTITHGLGSTPVVVLATGSVAGEIVSVTAIGATTFTVAIKLHDGTAGTSQTIYWQASES